MGTPLTERQPLPASPDVPWVSYQATLDPVTANHVTGSGTAMVQLSGNTAKITVTASGLVGGASPHAMHLHVDGGGVCPKPSEAKQHNGHSSTDVADAMKDYGMIGTSLTTSGDSSANASSSVPSALNTLPPGVVGGTAVSGSVPE